MAMAWVWTLMGAAAVLFALFRGTMDAVSAAALSGAAAAVELTLAMAGPILLWSGGLEALRRTGIAAAMGRRLRFVLRRLFPSAGEDGALAEDLTANVTANLLGLGNAATPAGVRAARRLAERPDGEGELARLVVMNTASVQLIPATAAALRAAMGSAAPMDILPAVWVTSALSVTAGLLAERALRR